MTTRSAAFFVLSTLALAACSQPLAAPEPIAKAKAHAVLDEGAHVPEALLRDAMEAHVGVPELGEARVVQSWTWHPRGSLSYVVWVTCRGEDDERLCAIAAAPSARGFVTLTAKAPIGRAPARSIAADGESLSVFGEDAKGTWSQSLVILGEAIAIGERSYAPSCSR